MPQQNQHTSELHHAKEVESMIFPACCHSPKVFQPRPEPLDLIAASIAPQDSAVLRGWFAAVALMRCDQLDAVFPLQVPVQRITVVPAIADQPGGYSGNEAGLERSFQQRALMRRSACNPYGDRKTMAVCDCHDLAPFAALRWTNARAPFLAPMKEPSMKLSAKSSWPRASRSSASAHSTPSITPSRTQCWKRRWQVWYGPYRAGRSCQDAPVLRMNNIPFNTCRASLGQRPRRSVLPLQFHCKKGFTNSHCVSVISMPSSCAHSPPNTTAFMI